MVRQRVKIAPSILSCDFLNLEREIENIQAAGGDILHLDVMDGHFVPNLTFGFPIIEQISKICKIPLDVHLMVSNPSPAISKLLKMDVDYISFHQEVAPHANRLIARIKDSGKKAGVVLNPSTPVCLLEDIVADVDFILLMSVNPGFGGQEFLPQVFKKLEKLQPLKDKYGFEIEVDGGVNQNNCKDLFEKGVDILVAGAYIFGQFDYKQRINSLKKF